MRRVCRFDFVKMWSSIGLGFVLLFAVFAPSAKGQDTYYLNDDVEDLLKGLRVTCNPGDIYCSAGCKELVLCSGDGSSIMLDDCASHNQLCDAATSQCKNASEVACASSPDNFKCLQEGLFPNPYDCHSYLVCTKEPSPTAPEKTTTEVETTVVTTEETTVVTTEETTVVTTEETTVVTTEETTEVTTEVTTVKGDDQEEEEGGSARVLPQARIPPTDCQPNPAENAFDPLSTTCRLSNTDRVCTEGPVPACQKVGQHGAVVENENMFYVCFLDEGATLQHGWFRCPNPAHVYVNGKCQARNATSVSTTTAASTPPTSTEPSTPPTSTAASTPPTSTEPSTPPTSTEPSTPPTSTEPSTPPTSTEHTTPPTSTEPSTPPTSTEPSTPPTSTEPSTPPTSTEPSTPPTSTEPSTPPTSTEPSTSPTSTTTSPTTTTGRTTTPYLCTEPNTVIPFPGDCRKFYICDNEMHQILNKCKEGYCFSAFYQICVKCIDCIPIY